MENNRRFIEETFPVKEVGAESAKEKHIRHGHISTLHIWWARRPLASSRTTNYAALVPAPDNIDEWNKKRQFIIDFSKWENSLNPALIEWARKDILEANGGKARKLAQSCGIDLAVEWNRSGFITKEKEFIRVLGPQDRKLEELEGSSKLIDVLHRVLLLWEKSKRSEMVSLLQESGFGRSEAFYRVAQAVSESLTLESKEKKLLAGRERLKKEVKKEQVQRRLFE
jgi:hypothetical protein